MQFNSFEFPVFFGLVLLALLLSRRQGWRKGVLLVASYSFYGWWDVRFLVLIWVSTLIDYFLGGRIAETTNQFRRKRLLAVSVVMNLGVLGFFKYCNFFIESANALLEPLGFHLGTLAIILPVGISFFTFQSMSYTIDIYRGRLQPAGSLLDFALFVAFFPQLVAGPIVRASDFLPQLKNPIRFRGTGLETGAQIFLFGLVKKVIIADRIAQFVDPVFADPLLFDSLTLWLASLGYTIQIFCDFSGYSDMAIGLALILGFRLPRNFNLPYLSSSIAEFWRRWHISLSSWLRDYLYIPLGGNRRGVGRTYINLVATMLLGGLWHGASWNFVLWGGLHGVALAGHRWLTSGSRSFWWPEGRAGAVAGWIVTMSIVVFGWILFRTDDIDAAISFTSRMISFSANGVAWYFSPLLMIFPLVIAAHAWGRNREGAYPLVNLRTFRGQFVFAFVLMALFFLAPTDSSPFIYFQF
ncbi:MAG: MBOAT family protein [Verrucomicrobiales bacterium]